MDSSFHARPHVPSSRARSLEILRRLIILLLTAVLLAGLLFLLAAAPDGQAAAPPAGIQRPNATNVDVDVTSDTTWTLAGSPWILTRDITVTPGVTLTVEPGVTVKGVLEAELRVAGRLVAVGTPDEPITFTSSADTAKCQWKGLLFDGGSGQLDHALVRYGGYNWNSASRRSNITVRNVQAGELRLDNSQVSNIDCIFDGGNPIWSADYGLYVADSRVSISQTLFTANGGNFGNVLDWPLYIDGPSSHVTLTNNTFTGNIRDRVGLANGAMMAHDTTLTRQAALEAYQFNHPSVINAHTVPATVTLTLEPGVMAMFPSDTELKVLGRLVAPGTPTQPITFTSVTNTGSGQWRGLVFDGGTGLLQNVTVRYGAGGFSSVGPMANIAIRDVQAGEVRIEASRVVTVTGGPGVPQSGLSIDESRVAISDTLFSGNGDGNFGDWPLHIEGASSVVTLTNNTFLANNPNRIGLAPGAMSSHDASLVRQDGIESYQFTGAFSVPVGITLTVDPGVMVMTPSGAELTVFGRLVAPGTSSQPITFTSVTNTGTGQWMGLVFDGGTGLLQNAAVRYGAGGFSSVGPMSNIAIRGVQAGEVRIEASRVLTVTGGPGVPQRGLSVDRSRVAVSDSLFSGNGDGNVYDWPLYIEGASSVVTLTNNAFLTNNPNRIGLAPAAMMGHDTTLVRQHGLEAFQFTGAFSVPVGITLSVDPGVTVMTPSDAELTVFGRLVTPGTASQPITFTSATNTGPSQWMGLVFDGGTGLLQNTTVRYGGGGWSSVGPRGNVMVRNVQDGEVRLESSRVLTTSGGIAVPQHGLSMSNSRVALVDTLFAGNGDGSGDDWPLYVEGPGSVLTMTGNTFIANVPNRIGLAPGALMSRDLTLSPRNGLQAYQFTGDYIVPPTRTLTVDPGVMVMGLGNTELIVQGRLNAVGTPSLPITFTSSTDTGTTQWGGLAFDGGTGHLRNATVRFAGYSSSIGPFAGISARNVPSGGLRVEDSAIHTNRGAGIRLADSVAVISNTVLTGNTNGVMISGTASIVELAGDYAYRNTSDGVQVLGNGSVVTMTRSSVVLNGAYGVYANGVARVLLGGSPADTNDFVGNKSYGVYQEIVAGAVITATYNWWGHATGPFQYPTNEGGKGDRVSGQVVYDPWMVDRTGSFDRGVYLDVVGPTSAAPGRTASYVLTYANLTNSPVESATVVLSVPFPGEYLDSTGGGIFWPERSQVFWRLGSLPAGAAGALSARVRMNWGVPEGVHGGIVGQMLGANLTGTLELQPFLDYVPVSLVSAVQLNETQVNAERQAWPDLDLLYTQALSAGLSLGRAEARNLSGGEVVTHITMMKLDSADAVYLWRQGDRVMAEEYRAGCYGVRQPAGGVTVTVPAGSWQYWGTWVSGSGPQSVSGQVSAGQCFLACVMRKLPLWLISKKIEQIGNAVAAASCFKCIAGDMASCNSCATALSGLPGVDDALELYGCAEDSVKPDCPHTCTKDLISCSGDWNFWKLLGVPSYYKVTCYNGVYGIAGEYLTCAAGDKCVEGVGCVPCRPPNCVNTEIRTPRDPNAKYGPEGDLVPGQRVTYTIAYENVGEGEAYGVYIVDRLSENLDQDTLTVYAPGSYVAATRQIVWTVGELGPKGSPTAAGTVSFSVKLKTGLAGGTPIINAAEVHFPSAPEVTPTNPVVNIVQPVAATPQQLTTGYMQPVDIVLGGLDPGGVNLTYSIASQPANGVVAGTPPTVTYTPTVNFTGPDSFTFRANNGITDSRPAEVQIMVLPSAADTAPPEVLWTDPVSGAMGIAVAGSPAFIDAGGPVYPPFPLVQFSEAISETTLTGGAMELRGPGGQSVAAGVLYNGTTRRAILLPRQPLAGNTWYTVTLSTTVRDLAGNALPEPHSWGFRTAGAYRSYLPLVMRGQ